MVLGACVWNDEPADVDLIQELAKRTSAIVPKGETWSVYYLGFAANGWKDGAAEQADQIIQTTAKGKLWQSVGVRLLDLNEVDEDLSRWPGFLAPPAI